MKGEKEITIANFNCVFGENSDIPMLKEFKRIIFPAFNYFEKRKSGRAEYFFYEIKLINSGDFGFYLVGKVVKRTNLEIKSEMKDENTLIEVDKTYGTAPFSEFILLLKNHRMLFAPNQAGSPSINEFKKLISHNIKAIISANHFEEDGKKFKFELDIFEMPSEIALTKELEETESIEYFRFEVAPLNNDIFDESDFESLSKEREETGSKKIIKKYENPSKMESIIPKIKKLYDMATYSIRIKKKDGNTKTIFNSTYKEKLTHYFPENRTDLENYEEAINLVYSDKRVSRLSKDNENVYNETFEVLESLKKWGE